MIDTILPWVAIPQEDKLLKHIYSFIQAIERMGVTSLLTIPRPVSPLAHILKNYLEQQIPVVFTLDRDENGKYTFVLNKYEGKPTLPPPIPFIITRGAGILRAPKKIPEEVPPPPRPARQACRCSHPLLFCHSPLGISLEPRYVRFLLEYKR